MRVYIAIKECAEEYEYPVDALCQIAHVARSAYYIWLKNVESPRKKENENILTLLEQLYNEDTSKGYRRLRDDLEKRHGIKISDKRALRLCRVLGIKSTIKYTNNGCTINASNPQHIAENILNRNFHAEAPNDKWLTDVTEFKYHDGSELRKVFLSAIIDLYDRRIVSYVIRDNNDTCLVFDTLDAAIASNPGAHPMLHSDRGFQYTTRAFHIRLENAGMQQSMSRVGKCIDNGPMEGFWGIIKRERYYKKRFDGRDAIVSMIETYIAYYNNRRLQRKLGLMTPMEKYELYQSAA